MSHSMTTELEEAQQAYREAARDFAQAELAPHAARWVDRSGQPWGSDRRRQCGWDRT